MSEGNVKRNKKKPESKLDRAKEVARNNWKPFTVGVVVTTGVIVTAIVTKRVIFPRYLYMCSGGTNFIMHRPILKKSPVYYVTNMFGAPYNRLSRAIRCVETGEETLSISKMASEMGLSASHICQHLNFPEMYPSVKGYHFESLGYTMPNKGNWDLLNSN